MCMNFIYNMYIIIIRVIFLFPFTYQDIENLTHKTGNYKQFDVFVAMLQSGLLKVTVTFLSLHQIYIDLVIKNNLQTSESITLDLLTFEDLELLRSRKIDSSSISAISNKANNRRYLILTYTVEFDRETFFFNTV